MTASVDMDQYIPGEVFSPSILVISTEFAKQSVASIHGGLSVGDLLSPFGGYYTPITAQYRVIDRSVRVHGFKAKFFDSSSYVFSPQVAEDEAAFIFRQCSAGQEHVRQQGFSRWFSGFCAGLRFAPFDCLNQPVATALVVSSEEENVIDAFEQLSHVANQPELARTGVLDPTSARVKILVHDVSGHKSIAQAEAIINQLKSIYSANSVIFLPINSSPGSVVPDIHSLFVKHTQVGERVPRTAGQGLSWEDVDKLNLAGEQIICDNAIPWMERKLQLLDNNITAKRKGLRNQLRNFLKAPDTASPLSSGQLSVSQVEWQCRLAGDMAFHLRAYDLALSYYRNVCSDFKQEKSLSLAAAGCYEMSGLAGFMSDQSSVSFSELSRFLETAVELYKEGRSPSHALRSALLQSFVLKGRHEAAEKLIKANGDLPGGSLRSAILLDRAAYLHGVAGMERKEAFTRVLAGHMFNKVEGGKEWALVAYSSVLSIYGDNWCYIKDHLLFTMAKLEFALGHIEESERLMVDLMSTVNDAHRPPGTAEKHTNYLKLLSYIAKARQEFSRSNSRTSRSSSFDGPESPRDRKPVSIPVIPVPVVSVQYRKVTGDTVSLRLFNPLFVSVEVSELTLKFSTPDLAESELSGLIHLEVGESKEVSLQVVRSSDEDEVIISSVQWVLNGGLTCQLIV